MKLDKTAGKISFARAKPNDATTAKIEKPKMQKAPKAVSIKTARKEFEESMAQYEEEEGPILATDVVNGQMDIALAKFKEAARKETANFGAILDSEFWFCMCFESRKHKDEFLAKHALSGLGDKYIDGHAASVVLGKPLQTPRIAFPVQKANKGYHEFVDPETDDGL